MAENEDGLNEREEEAPEAEEERGSTSGIEPGPRPLVLIAAGDRLARLKIKQMLSQHCFEVLTASSGREVLELVKDHALDLVIVDAQFENPGGLEVLEMLRGQFTFADLAIVLHIDSGDEGQPGRRDVEETTNRALQLGANDVVIGALDRPLSMARLETQIALRQARAQARRINEKLGQFTAHFDRLNDASTRALDDVAAWVVIAAREVAQAIGVSELGAWSIVDERLAPLYECGLEPPAVVDLALVLKGRRFEREADTVYPVIGFSDDLSGALVIPKRESFWNQGALTLIDTFARQLGGVLELVKVEEQLGEGGEATTSVPPQHPTLAGEAVQVCSLCGQCFDASRDHCTSCGPGTILRSTWTIPSFLDERYRLVKLLGQGGMGMVFAAHDERLDREVAIKFINPCHMGNQVVRGHFQHEARVVASLRDPGVVAVFDCGDLENGSFFIVMERLHGYDLDILVDTCGSGTPAEVATFLRQAAKALDVAHRAEIIHRDIKPANFILAPAQVGFDVKILDFGFSLDLDVDGPQVQMGAIVGTPRYMSPEQAMGEPLDYRTDLYSLAVVAYRALVGRHMVDNQEHEKILRQIVTQVPPSLSTVLPDMPREIDKAFGWALEKSPEKRPMSAESWVASFVYTLESVRSQAKGWFTKKSPLYLSPAASSD